MDFEERRAQILKILPKTMRLEIFKNLASFTSIPQIKEWIRIQTEYETEWEQDDKVAKGKSLNAMEQNGEPVVPQCAWTTCPRPRTTRRS